MIPKIKKVNLSTQLMDTMISLIENGTWKTGEKLPNEIELANSFSVSRNIMRESMKILENFGILDSKTGIGTYISENAIGSICNMRFFESLKNNSSIEKLLETRLIIEPELAYYATLRATDEEIIFLKHLLEEDTKKHVITNFFHTDDFHFHRQVAKYARNDILENLLTTILEQLSADEYGNFNKFVDNSIKMDSFNDHMSVFQAIQKRDPLLAKDIMYRHLFARMKVINPDYGTNLTHSEKIRDIRLEQSEQQK
ncbi:FadR/GntR family transcriptional regulator [Anaerotignum propionicum]|jgi:DNA-binding FadR family transcriptional regulator|uniref:FadR/GntR family transcriptional regulator n=1 Tax=Anaerotignum propionicum TaxID=28446 RepID=UPI002899349A|nr:FadR/GntR family transcriptional regulator [Anaerotignum propionicum]